MGNLGSICHKISALSFKFSLGPISTCGEHNITKENFCLGFSIFSLQDNTTMQQTLNPKIFARGHHSQTTGRLTNKEGRDFLLWFVSFGVHNALDVRS
jgi:hypothetical protein